MIYFCKDMMKEETKSNLLALETRLLGFVIGLILQITKVGKLLKCTMTYRKL